MKQPRPDYIGQEDNYITLDPAELGNAGYPLVISAIAPRYQGPSSVLPACVCSLPAILQITKRRCQQASSAMQANCFHKFPGQRGSEKPQVAGS